MPAQTPEEMHALLTAAFNAGDHDAFVQLYEEDAHLIVPPGGERVVGGDAIRAATAPTFALRPKATSEVAWKLQSDGLALTQARWEFVIDGPV